MKYLNYGIFFMITFACFVIKPMHVKENVVYEGIFDIKAAILTNAAKPKIVLVTLENKIKVIDPEKKEVKVLPDKEEYAGILGNTIYKSNDGTTVYLTLNFPENKNKLLKLDVDSFAVTLTELGSRVLIGFQDPFLLFKDPQINRSSYFPLITHNLMTGKKTTFNLKILDTKNVQQVFLEYKNIPISTHTEVKSNNSNSVTHVPIEKGVIVNNFTKGSLYSNNIVSNDLYGYSSKNYVPLPFPQTIYAQKNKSFIAQGSAIGCLGKYNFVGHNFKPSVIFRPILDDANKKLSLEFCDYSGDESLLVAKTSDNLYFFLPSNNGYTLYTEPIEATNAGARYLLGGSKDYLLEIKNNKHAILYKLAYSKALKIETKAHTRTNNSENIKDNIFESNKTRGSIWWQSWRKYLVSVGFLAGVGYFGYHTLRKNAQAVISKMASSE